MAVWLIRHRAQLLGRHSAPEAVDVVSAGTSTIRLVAGDVVDERRPCVIS